AAFFAHLEAGAAPSLRLQPFVLCPQPFQFGLQIIIVCHVCALKSKRRVAVRFRADTSWHQRSTSLKAQVSRLKPWLRPQIGYPVVRPRRGQRAVERRLRARKDRADALVPEEGLQHMDLERLLAVEAITQRAIV